MFGVTTQLRATHVAIVSRETRTRRSRLPRAVLCVNNLHAQMTDPSPPSLEAGSPDIDLDYCASDGCSRPHHPRSLPGAWQGSARVHRCGAPGADDLPPRTADRHLLSAHRSRRKNLVALGGIRSKRTNAPTRRVTRMFSPPHRKSRTRRRNEPGLYWASSTGLERLSSTGAQEVS